MHGNRLSLGIVFIHRLKCAVEGFFIENIVTNKVKLSLVCHTKENEIYHSFKAF